jgi:hypothetical protein
MADNFPLTPGSGRNAATDQVTYSGDTADVQLIKPVHVTGAEGSKTTVDLIKLEDDAHTSGDAGIMALAVRKDNPAALGGADGDYAPLEVDAVGRQWVRPAPVQTRIQITPTISTSAYASGDVIGGSSASIALSNAARVSGGSGLVQSILVLDKTQAQRAAMDILFFDRSVTAAADNAAVATSDADMAYCLGVVPIGPYNTAWPGTPLNSISTLINVGLPFVLNGTDLHIVIVCRGTPTYGTTSDLTFTFTILQD